MSVRADGPADDPVDDPAAGMIDSKATHTTLRD
jgi:hypothetical protein